MSLLSVDITKVKRLSLQEVKQPPQERIVEPVTPIQVNRSPSEDEIAWSVLLKTYPVLDDMAELLGLVSISTGEPVKKIDQAPELKAKDILEPEKSYLREEIVERIATALKLSSEGAERELLLMINAGELLPILQGGRYYLNGSTPF